MIIKHDWKILRYSVQTIYWKALNLDSRLITYVLAIFSLFITRVSLKNARFLYKRKFRYVFSFMYCMDIVIALFYRWGNLNPINSLEAPLKHRDWISKKMTQDREKYVLRLQAIPQQASWTWSEIFTNLEYLE